VEPGIGEVGSEKKKSEMDRRAIESADRVRPLRAWAMWQTSKRSWINAICEVIHAVVDFCSKVNFEREIHFKKSNIIFSQQILKHKQHTQL
jgi:hypothetical protein